MKIHRDIWQGSLEWEQKRSQFVTASEMSALVSPTGEIRKGKMPHTLLMEKVACFWTGGPLPSAQFWDGEQGNFLEEYARPAFTLETGLEVETVGFIENGRIGCSPDGLIGDGEGLEIKCPRLDTHIKYLLAGIVPEDYVIQVQASLAVTGFKTWKFFSFRRGMPPLILTAPRIEAIQDAIQQAVYDFISKLDKALEKLTELNGGVRPKHYVITPEQKPKPETQLEVENLN